MCTQWKLWPTWASAQSNQNLCCLNEITWAIGHPDQLVSDRAIWSGPEVIKLFSYTTQLSTKFLLLINVKMPTIVGSLAFISMMNTTSERHKARNFFSCRNLFFMSSYWTLVCFITEYQTEAGEYHTPTGRRFGTTISPPVGPRRKRMGTKMCWMM